LISIKSDQAAMWRNAFQYDAGVSSPTKRAINGMLV
jgi:hypothetical protein